MSYWVTFQRKTQRSLISNNKWNRHLWFRWLQLWISSADVFCWCQFRLQTLSSFFHTTKGYIGKLMTCRICILFWIAQLHPINHSISKERVGSIYHWRNDECFHENLVGWFIWFLNFLMKICLRFIIVNVMTQGCKT